MTYTIRLCGGHADGQTFPVNGLPPAWETIEPSDDLRYWVPDEIPTDALTLTRVTYYPLGITARGEHLYAIRELFNQLRTAFERQRFMRDMPPVGELPDLRLRSDEELAAEAARLRDRINNREADPWEDSRLDDPVNTRVYPEPIASGLCTPSSMKGPDPFAELPAAPLWRKKTDKLIREIDEVTEDDL